MAAGKVIAIPTTNADPLSLTAAYSLNIIGPDLGVSCMSNAQSMNDTVLIALCIKIC